MTSETSSNERGTSSLLEACDAQLRREAEVLTAELEQWRGHGIYRALVSARAGSAIGRGVRYLQSDCTAMSRPILERSGLVPVTTTTPFVWQRDPTSA